MARMGGPMRRTEPLGAHAARFSEFSLLGPRFVGLRFSFAYDPTKGRGFAGSLDVSRSRGTMVEGRSNCRIFWNLLAPPGGTGVADNLPANSDNLEHWKQEALRRYGTIREDMRRAARSIAAWGQALYEVRARIPHGEWMPWVSQNFPYGYETIRSYIQFATKVWPLLPEEVREDPRLPVDRARKLVKLLPGPDRHKPTGVAAKVLAVLDSVMPGLDLTWRGIVEHSTYFAFRNGEVITYNGGTISCRAPAPRIMGRDLQGAVPAVPLLKLLRFLARDPVNPRRDVLAFTVRGNELHISTRRCRAAVRMDRKIALPLDELERPGESAWVPLAAEFGHALESVLRCAGKDMTQPRTTRVYIHPKWLEAWDNHQLCRWNLETGMQTPTQVHHSVVEALPRLGVTHVAKTEHWLHFRNPDGLVYSCCPDADDFPDLGKLLHVNNPTPLTLPAHLRRALERAEMFSRDQDNNLLRIRLRTDGTMSIRGEGVSGWYRQTFHTAYEGPDREFLLPPDHLREIMRRVEAGGECFVGDDRLKVEDGPSVYITCVTPPPEQGQTS
jgi:hypothetical protein